MLPVRNKAGIKQALAQTPRDPLGMNMAKAAANLITDNLRYPNGAPIDVVIADTTIGGVAEAASCQAKFEREGVGVTLTVSPCDGLRPAYD